MFKSSFAAMLLTVFMASPVAQASFIPPVTSFNHKPVKIQTPPIKIHSTIAAETSEFHQELQWRILNLLAQQLFDDSQEIVAGYLFMSNWLYETSAFSVDISAMNPEFLEVKIIDASGRDETRLEIPRL